MILIPKDDYVIPRARYVAFNPQVWNGFSETDPKMLKIYGCKLDDYFFLFGKDGCYNIISKKQVKNCERTILSKFLNENNFFPKIWQAHLKYVKTIPKIIWEINKQIPKSNSEALAIIISKIQRIWIEFDQKNVFAWYLGTDPLKQHIERVLNGQYGISAEKAEILFTADSLSLAAAEDLAVLKFALAIKKNPNFIEKYAKALSKNFGWMSFGYDGPIYNFSEAYIKILKNKLRTNRDSLKKQILAIHSRLKFVQIQQKDLIRKYKLDKEVLRLLGVIQKCYVLTDQRKQVHFQIHYVFNNALKKISEITKIPLIYLKYLDIPEIEKVLLKNKAGTLQKLGNLRSKSPFFVRVKNGEINKTVIGIKAIKEIKKYAIVPVTTNSITGMVANSAKKVFKGKVRIVRSALEVRNMKNGEILVTWMTTPDLVPAMRKAKAVITDEGGITSHAAIVSRELGIPCIIGTKYASKLFKDGDVVEVDAERGIVKKIK